VKLSIAAQIYLWSVVASGVAVTAGWLQEWRGGFPADPTGVALMLLLGTLAVASQHFPLALSPRYKVNLAVTAYFAGLLLFGMPAALALVGVSQLVGGLSLAARRHPVPGRRMRTLRSVAFNAAQALVSAGAAGAVYYGFTPHAAPAALNQLSDLWTVPLAAATFYVVNSFAVAVMVGLQLREHPLDVWLLGRRRDALQFAGLFFVGLLTARTAYHDPWIPLLMALPSIIIYLSLKRTVQLIVQTTSAVEAMADVVDRRDHYTFEHSKRVAEYAVQIAQAVGLPGEEIETIRLAARVHDLGKIGVPDHVLRKAGPLDPEEWHLMQQHPAIGWEILSNFPEYGRGRELVLHHHERLDGKGYPDGVAGHRIHLGAQVIAVADAFDAMTSQRPYRSAMSREQALAEIHRCRGTQWDELVVDALDQVFGTPQTQRRRLPIRTPLRIPAAA
jgi:HD-GYP domain-containing protein (c-di-GMP phosphodiesterase class II)